MEQGAVADECDELGCVDFAPACLGGLDQLVSHGYSCGAGAWSLGDFRPQSHCGEGGFDRVRGAEVNPMLGRVFEELEQHVEIVDDFATAFGYFFP